MKKNLYTALIISILCMSIVPTVNLHRVFTTQSNVKWWKRKVLYNMDFIFSGIGQLTYLYGVSIDPTRVVIGKQGWLFLGDDYAHSITSKRMAISAEDSQTLETVAGSARAWNQWLSDMGVAAFRIVIGPDKDSVYPEYLPDWSAHSTARLTDSLVTRARENIYVDPTRALIQAKSDYSAPLYYTTDTHWNNLGAWVAFDELRKSLSNSQAALLWPQARDPMIMESHMRGGGDLAHFLRIQDLITDREVALNLHAEYAMPVEHHDFNSGAIVFSGKNTGIASPAVPLLVKSKHALNRKKVLWLRDSFGSAMAPLMTATFTDTLHVYYPTLTPETLVALVELYQPDYVFVTSVERDIRGEFFQSTPTDGQ
ncbi:alginate O-acetyltransferase AlgX-related protein [Pseudomonas sp. P2757]|uniref:alginate O-acetyltransferase AlgX-related protein n=1 Tax=unclassified Pseudomonas TaxID=196821 RepID=UPI003B5C1742